MEKHVEQQGCRVTYDYLPGNKDITVVLVHGYGLHRKMWIPQVEFLQENGYPIINVDVRGHGHSRPTSDFSVKLAAEDIKTIINEERCEHFILCGLSMGAFVVQEYVFLFGGADGYMLTGVTPLCIVYPKWEKTLLRCSGPIMKYLYTWKSLKKAMSKGSVHTKAAQAAVAKMFDEIEKPEFLVSWEGFVSCLHEENLVFDAPLLVASGEYDTRGTIQKHLPDWKQKYPNCTVKIIAEAGHAANLDQPEMFNKILLDFILSLYIAHK
jgi:pimeloyl-ACP methyl ester carboxylesterase